MECKGEVHRYRMFDVFFYMAWEQSLDFHSCEMHDREGGEHHLIFSHWAMCFPCDGNDRTAMIFGRMTKRRRMKVRPRDVTDKAWRWTPIFLVVDRLIACDELFIDDLSLQETCIACFWCFILISTNIVMLSLNHKNHNWWPNETIPLAKSMELKILSLKC